MRRHKKKQYIYNPLEKEGLRDFTKRRKYNAPYLMKNLSLSSLTDKVKLSHSLKNNNAITIKPRSIIVLEYSTYIPLRYS